VISADRTLETHMKIKDHIPNLITLLNLICGSMAIFLAFSGEMTLASWFIILAAILDFTDGMAARLLHAKSDIGAQLDSLADVVSFGLAPSAIMYQLILQSPDIPAWSAGNMPLLPFAALLLVAGGAYRLAKFNTDPGQEVEFKGLPIPATGLFVAALPLIINQYRQSEKLAGIIQNHYVLLAIIIFLSWLMVSNIPMISLKFKNLNLKDNISKFILLGSVPVLFIFFRFSAVPMIIFLYIIISIISLSLKTKNS
jgi:CDP-diacylglycerol---serine O-phosphatidyltransferase